MKNKKTTTTLEETWDLVIEPKTSWFQLHLADLWRYRDLVLLFVKRDLSVTYKQTILGPVWFLIQPLFSTIIFTVIFGKIAKIPTDGIPPFLFYMAGNVAWGYFANSLNGTSNTFVKNSGIFGKVYFPRLAIPLSIVISNLAKFAVQLLLFAGFYSYFALSGAGLKIDINILYLPVIILQMAILALGVGVLISSMVTKYRDLTVLMTFGVQLWMYATPVVYPVSQVPEKYQFFYLLNPMAVIIENFKYIFFHKGTILPDMILISWITTVVIFFLGLLVFNRVEKGFMDTV
ncbi:MAG: ABC transporter permease [Leptospirales bacterium]